MLWRISELKKLIAINNKAIRNISKTDLQSDFKLRKKLYPKNYPSEDISYLAIEIYDAYPI